MTESTPETTFEELTAVCVKLLHLGSEVGPTAKVLNDAGIPKGGFSLHERVAYLVERDRREIQRLRDALERVTGPDQAMAAEALSHGTSWTSRPSERVEIDRVTRLLMDEWARSGTGAAVATFAAMARAVVTDRSATCVDVLPLRERVLAVSLKALLDAVDYVGGGCRPTEQVAAVLPTILITRAREALARR